MKVEDGANAGNDLVTVVAVVEYKGISAAFPVLSRVYPVRVLLGFLPNLGKLDFPLPTTMSGLPDDLFFDNVRPDETSVAYELESAGKYYVFAVFVLIPIFVRLS